MTVFPLTRKQLLCIGYVLVHTLLHLAAFWFEVLPGIAVSIWYAPSGLALALLVLMGPRYALLVFLTHFATSWISHTPRVPWTAFFFPGLLTATYTLAAWWVRRTIGPRLLPGSLRETWVFLITIVGSPVIPAVIGTAVITLTSSMNHPQSFGAFFSSVRDWWIGDASGLVTIVPVAMVFLGPWLEGKPFLRRRESGARLATILFVLRGASLVGMLAIVVSVPVLREHRAFYLCFLPLVWICVSDGLRGATLASLGVMIVGLISMRQAGTTAAYSYIFLLFEIAVAGVGLGLGTMVERRNEAEAKLTASNRELARLRRLEFNEKIEAKLSEEKARLELLRYQLNPHFLYNSLNSIYGLLFESPKAAGEMVLKLSDFCRATLDTDPDELPTLGAEVDAMRSYLEVEMVRWRDKLEVEFEVPEEVEHTRVPPFILLPLVENAVKYGSRTSSDLLRIRICASQSADKVTLEILNTGSWQVPDMDRPESTGIGLENLRQRLQRYYPDRHGFEIEDQGGWVSARIMLSGQPQPMSAEFQSSEFSASPFGD